MIRFENAELRNGGFHLAADIEIPGPGITAVIGPSGSGKSTLLMALAGFVPVIAGRILVDGVAVEQMDPARRPVSMLFQDHNLFAHLDVETNVAIGLRPDLRLTEAQRRAVAEALASVGLEGLATRKPGALSDGQHQRVASARALLRDRPVLLLDEAFGALGPGLRADMLALVQRVAHERGLTVLMVTHAPEDARAIAQHVVFVDGVRAQPPVPTSAFFADPPPGIAAYLGLD